MKKSDAVFFSLLLLLLLPFFISEPLFLFYKKSNLEHPLYMGFIKFGILATLGEIIGLRIKKGHYLESGFGILPKVIIWGFLGMSIVLAFSVFKNGVAAFLESMNLTDARLSLKSDFSLTKLITAAGISISMNVIFAPVMMTFHKITDTHIHKQGGSITALWKPIPFAEILQGLDWKLQWNFVFLKTIPFFWIPAHTITFLLPEEYQILFAALLSIFLGILLSFAALSSSKNLSTKSH